MANKVVFIGAEKTGKTAIARWLAGHDNYLAEYRPTIGNTFEQVSVGSKEMRLWDVSGSDRYNGLIPIYAKNSAVVCLVIDKSNPQSISDLWSLLRKSRSSMGDSKFLIVVNQTTDENLVSEESLLSVLAANNIPEDSPRIEVNPGKNTGKNELMGALEQFCITNKNADKPEFIFAEKPTPQENSSPFTLNINMTVLNGFIAAMGVVAVALAFAALKAAALGTVLMAGAGVATILVGVGLFAKRASAGTTGADDNQQPDFYPSWDK